MKRETATYLLFLAMIVLGVLRLFDIILYTNELTLLFTQGSIVERYVIYAIVPFFFCFWVSHKISTQSMAIFQTPNPSLAVFLAASSFVSILVGLINLVICINNGAILELLISFGYIWYGVWVLSSARQFYKRTGPTPNIPVGIAALATLPFILRIISNVLVDPTSVYRITQIFEFLAGVLALTWVSLFIKGVYASLSPKLVKTIYAVGILTFLFCSCYGAAQTIGSFFLKNYTAYSFLEAVILFFIGLAAAWTSLIIADKSTKKKKKEKISIRF